MDRPAPPKAPISCSSVAESRAFVYLLRCADGTLYCGWTVDVDRRLAAHASGRASRYTASRLPVELAATWELESPRAARRVEWQIKQLTRTEKLALLDGEALPAPPAFQSRMVPGRVRAQITQTSSAIIRIDQKG
jgi:putative endonuclease